MKRLLIYIVFIILLPQVVNAVLIEVKIPKVLEGKLTSISCTLSFNLLELQTEFYNTGSTSYKARVRLDVFNNSEKIFTGWSEERILMPGDRKNFKLYYYTNSTGNFTLRVRSYFGNEILEQNHSLEKGISFSARSVFRIENFRAYESFAIFDLTSEESVRDVVVIPLDFPLSWIFEQKKIEYIPKGARTTVVLSYQPDVWIPENITIAVVAQQGLYYTEETVVLEKETGIIGAIHYAIDLHKIALSRLLDRLPSLFIW